MERLRLKKGLGQHHLRDSSLCRPLIDYLRPSGDQVLEIGLGGGVLTAALLAAGARVTAWELDEAWAFAATRAVGDQAGLRVVVGDALELPWNRLPGSWKVAGNLPYNVATPLLDAMLDRTRPLAAIAILVQLEVAERLVARPGTKAYGALTVLTELRAEARILGRVRPGSFVPPPKVESAFVGLTPRPQRLTGRRYGDLRSVVHAAFGQRRKTLRNALAARWPRTEVVNAIEAAGLEGGVRAEQVPPESFVELSNRLVSV